MKTLSETLEILIKNQMDYTDILTPQAKEFLFELHQKFDAKRKALLKAREERQIYFDAGNFPDFDPETKSIREGDWQAAAIPTDLQDRRVEITGPVDAKMVINALNSGAKTFMADFEDSNAPTWDNTMGGQRNLKAAVSKTLVFKDEAKNKTYALNETTAVLIVRPRGLHLTEKNIVINGEELSGSLVDFGLYFFHNAKQLLANGSGPYFYLPKLEHYTEARWWNEVFEFAQKYLQIPQATTKATILIETITAAFCIDEIIYELRDHIAGLNCGRWDYIFSYIKKFRNHPNFIVPNRDQVTMTSPFMQAYSLAVIKTCHKRAIHAIGGMAAQIPVKNDEAKNQEAFAKVKADKLREVTNGHDGTWVAHPGLVSVAMDVFNEHMPTPNQIHIKREDVVTTAEKLVELPLGTVTEKGVRDNINVGILYLESWLSGKGAAALYNLMEDAATAEISRTQLWQWHKNKVVLDTDKVFDSAYYEELKQQELSKIKDLVGPNVFDNGNFKLATTLFDDLVLQPDFQEFLTLKAYKHI